jgi:hypothetical protein
VRKIEILLNKKEQEVKEMWDDLSAEEKYVVLCRLGLSHRTATVLSKYEDDRCSCEYDETTCSIHN